MELIEVVQPDGTVSSVVSRAKMRKENLLHRSVFVVVLKNDYGIDGVPSPEVVVHQRSANKDINPGLWDVAFGGVCGLGESWLEAAKRELAEEAGIEGVELQHWGSGIHEDASLAVLGHVYVTTFDGELSFADGEVDRSQLVPVSQIEQWSKSQDICADSRNLVLPLLVKNLDPSTRREATR